MEKESSTFTTMIPDLIITPSTEEISSPTIETVFYSISPETSFNFNTNVETTNELTNESTTTSTTIHSTDKETDAPTTIPMTSPITYKEIYPQIFLLLIKKKYTD